MPWQAMNLPISPSLKNMVIMWNQQPFHRPPQIWPTVVSTLAPVCVKNPALSMFLFLC